MLFLLECGVRNGEVLSVRVEDIDFENLFVTVAGKGRKERKIPFSFELRKRIWKFKDRVYSLRQTMERSYPRETCCGTLRSSSKNRG